MAKITKEIKMFVDNQPISKIALSEKWAEERLLIKLDGLDGYWAADKTGNFMIYMPDDFIHSKIKVLPLIIAEETICNLEEFFDAYKNLDPSDYDVIYDEGLW